MNWSLAYSGLMLLVMLWVTACAPLPPPTATAAQPTFSTDSTAPTSLPEASETSAPMSTASTLSIPVTSHLTKPADPISGRLIADVASSGKSAPFGDSYKINRFERPFLKDMTYVPDLDIISFNLGEDADWYYISVELNGDDPNNPIGINYGVEIDLNADGFGDYMIWAGPPYTNQWGTSTVQAFQDSNHDSAGRSSKQSDAGFDGNGYDKLVFDGNHLGNSDPDLAWVRMQAGQHATIQFAIKKSWIGPSFAAGVLSDAGLKDVSKFDYNDHFKEAQAGSPLQTNQYYPLGALYAVDNTCWEAHDIQATAYEPKFCPVPVSPTATHNLPGNKPPTTVPQSTEPAPAACEPAFDPLECGNVGYNSDVCQCNTPTDEPVETEPPIVTEPPTATEPPAATEPPGATEPAPQPPPPTEPPASTEPPAATQPGTQP